jgi:hypothetical protein
MTTWAKFRDLINSKNVGDIFTKKDIQGKLASLNPSTIGGYFSYIAQAKFITRIGRGTYKLVDHLPENLTMGSLFALLRGDNLTYVESIQQQKDFKILKAQFIHERMYVLERLIEDLKPLIAYASLIETPAFGLKQLARNCKWERSKTPNPTRKWLKEHQERKV